MLNPCAVDHFNDKYHDPDDALRKFEEMVLSAITDTPTHWNFLPVVQSSGYGKTRMLLELGQTSTSFFASYWCLRDPQRDGSPPTTRDVYSYLLDLSQRSAEVVNLQLRLLFAAAVERVGTWPATTPADFWQRNRDKYLTGQLDELWNEVLTQAKRRLYVGQASTSSMESVPPARGATKPLVLMIDDARWLLSRKIGDRSMFRFVRGAARFTLGFALIFVDTVSKLSKPVPAAVNHPTSRIADAEKLGKLEVREPLIAVCAIDLDKNLPIASSGKLDIDRALKLGRPLWRIYSLPDRVYRAILKLGGLREIGTDTLPAIALLATRVTSIRPHTGKTAAELVASHMATCVGISADRSCVSAVYLSEPVLAEAAGTSWYQAGRLLPALRAFRSALQQGLATSGVAGEQVFPIMACLVKDDLVRRSAGRLFLTAEVPLSHWVCALVAPLSEAVVHRDNIPMLEREPMISFTHFACAWRNDPAEWLQQSSLKQLYHRAAAVILPNCQYGADFLVPVRLDKADTYGALFVQIKNYGHNSHDQHYPASAADKLAPPAIFGSPCDVTRFLGLYVMFGGDRAHEIEVWRPTSYEAFLQWKIHAAATASKRKRTKGSGTDSVATAATTSTPAGAYRSCRVADPAEVVEQAGRTAGKYDKMLNTLKEHRKATTNWDYANLAINGLDIEAVLARSCLVSDHAAVAAELRALLHTTERWSLGLSSTQAAMIAGKLDGWIKPVD